MRKKKNKKSEKEKSWDFLCKEGSLKSEEGIKALHKKKGYKTKRKNKIWRKENLRTIRRNEKQFDVWVKDERGRKRGKNLIKKE